MTDAGFNQAVGLAFSETDFMPPVRAGRHQVRLSMIQAGYALRGRTGLSKAEQVEKLTEAKDALSNALTALDALIQTASDRDFDAHKAAKHESLDPLFSDDDDDSDDQD